MKNKYIITLFIGLLTVCVVSFVPSVVRAANGDIAVTVKSELGYPVAGTGFSLMCTHGTATSSVSFVTNAAGTLTIASSTGLSMAPYGCRDGDVFGITATTTGYVSTTTYGTYSGSAVNNITATTSYTLKVIAMTSENDVNVMPTIGMPFSSTSPAVGQITVASSTYSGGVWYLVATSTAPAGATLMATSSGYINNTIANVVTSTSAQRTVAFDGGSSATYNSTSKLLYGLKVVTADQFGNSVTPLSASYRGNTTTSTNGSTLYWADTSATVGVLNIIAPGYLYATSTNTGFYSVKTASTTQVAITLGNSTATTTPITVSGTAKGLEAMLKISSFWDELGNSIMPSTGSPFSVSGALNLISQTYSGGAWYVAASSTNLVGGSLIASVDGYVTESVSSVLTSTTTQYTFDVGDTGSTYHIVGLPFALKVTAEKSSDSSALSGATVTSGNLFGTACSENSSTGTYYCAIPLSDTERYVKVVKSGFTTKEDIFTDRTSATDIQDAITLSLPEGSGGNTSNSSGGGIVGGGGWSPAPTIVPPIRVTTKDCPPGYDCKVNPANITPSVSPNFGSASIPSFLRRLVKGVSGDDVRGLQMLLNSDPETQISLIGVGSKGNETDFFGGLTTKAVQKFQVKYGIAKEGDEGYGQVGPKTRAKLNQLKK